MIPNSESQMDLGCPSSELAPHCQAAAQFTIPTYLGKGYALAIPGIWGREGGGR